MAQRLKKSARNTAGNDSKKRSLRVESLEDRRVLAAPTSGLDIQLPQSGQWQHTPFVGSPIFADLDNNGTQELITAASGGRLIAFSMNTSGVPAVYQTYETGSAANFRSTPAVVQLGDGRQAVFAALGRDEANPGTLETDKFYGWDAVTGQLLPGWPATLERNVIGQGGAFGAITSGDVTGDGQKEVIVTSFSHFVEVYRLDGSLVWRYNADDTIVSGAVVGDIDRDGRNEIVFGSDTSQSQFFDSGGFINVLDNQGSAKFRYHIDEVVWSSPVLADLTNDGNLEIIVGTGLNFDDFDPKPGARAAGNRLYAIDYKGDVLPGWPYHTTSDDNLKRQILGSPAVADIDQDGDLEVIAADRGGFLHVVQGNGQALSGWAGGKQIATQSAPQDGYASPIVADINGDGKPDIVVGNGPNLTGFDQNGNVIFQHITAVNPPEGHYNAAAVGQWNGTGGLELVSVSNVSAVPNRPSLISVFHLDVSTLDAPWAMLRRSGDGMAVSQSPNYVNQFITSAYEGLLQRTPGSSEIAYYAQPILNNDLTFLSLSRALSSSVEARDRVIDALYSQLLNRTPDSGGRAFWQGFLANNTIKAMAIQFAESAEFNSLGGGTTEGIVTRLYQTILNRTPSNGELQGWVDYVNANGLASVARLFWTSTENLTNQLRTAYDGAFGSSSVIPEDTLASYLFDNRHDRRREEEIFAQVIASNGNYAYTDNVSAWVRTLYRDVLNREAAAAEVALWLGAVDRGEVVLEQIANVMMNAPESRANVINSVYQALLGRDADSGAYSSFANYQSREEVMLAVMSSSEYVNLNGGTLEGYVRAAYRDLAGIDPAPASAVNQWVNLINSGTPASELPKALMASAEFYNKQVVEFLFRYLPNEAMGVLRTGNYPPGGAGQPVNPNPAFVNFFTGLRQGGVSSRDVVVMLLSSPEYVAKSSYFKGMYESTGVRV